MSQSTEPNTETSSESNSNGKRERESEAAFDEEPTSKMLRSSDDSDEKESDAPSSVDVTPVPELEKGGGVGDALEDIKTEEELPPKQLGEEETTGAAKQLAEGAPADPVIQIDRAGQEVTEESPVVAGNPAPAPAPAPAGLPYGVPGVDPNAQASVLNTSQIVEERGEVSALHVGRIIGKGGEMIRDLQARSGARIDVDQNVPQGQPRVITYRGTRETVDFAKHLVHMLSVQGVHENDLPLGNASQELLIIPSMSVGKVIGRGGEMIRELQSRSQAKIQIDHSGVSGLQADQKQVTITGTADSVTKAKEMVLFLVANPMCDAQQSLNMLIDDKMRAGGVWGSGPPYPNLPNQGTNMQPHMMPQPSQGYNYAQASVGGGYGSAQVGLHQYGGAPHGGPQYPQQAYPGVQPAAYAGSGSIMMGGGGRETEMIYAQKQFMGRIIGSKGVTVNDLQRRSGCDIQINQDVMPGQDCEITIKGSREGIESAKNMIKEIIEIGPHHPYAGGMGSGYGGGGGTYQQQNPYEQGGYGQQVPYQQAAGYGQGGVGYGYSPAGYMGGGGAGYGLAQQAAAAAPMAGGGYHGAHQQPQYGGYPQQQALAPPPQAHSTVASPWKAATAADGQVYYYNERTGETQWDKPAGLP